MFTCNTDPRTAFLAFPFLALPISLQYLNTKVTYIISHFQPLIYNIHEESVSILLIYHMYTRMIIL